MPLEKLWEGAEYCSRDPETHPNRSPRVRPPSLQSSVWASLVPALRQDPPSCALKVLTQEGPGLAGSS